MHELARAWMTDLILQSPVARNLGIALHSAEAEKVVVQLPFADSLTTVPGVLHGGIVSTLIDTAGAASSASGLRPEHQAAGGATTTLTVNYLAPCTTDLTATAVVVHRTKSATLSDVQVHDTHGALVATGQVNTRFSRKR